MRNLMKPVAGWRQVAVVVLTMGTVLQATDKGPDAGNYTATNNVVYSFIDPAGGGGSPSVLAGVDDGVAVLTLPFEFRFYGKSYTQICVSDNGLFYFIANAAACVPSTDFANSDLSSSAVPGDLPAIAPHWTDLKFPTAGAGAGAVYYQTTGTTPNQKFIVEWSNALPADSLAPVTFEAVLFEGSNNVLFQYQTLDPATRATVGIRDAGGNASNKQIQWSYNVNVLTNSSAILFTAPSETATSVNTITTAPPGVPVTIDGASTPSQTPVVVSWVPNSGHTLAVESPRTFGGTRTTLTNWTTESGTQTGTPINVTAPATGITYTANFSTDYLLTTSVNDAARGSVSAGGFFAAGNSPTVMATATAPYVFGKFTGDLTGATNPQTILMNGPKSVVANFYSKCDVSLDLLFTIDDVMAIIAEALGTATPSHNVNGAGGIDVLDIQMVVNAAMSQSCAAN